MSLRKFTKTDTHFLVRYVVDGKLQVRTRGFIRGADEGVLVSKLYEVQWGRKNEVDTAIIVAAGNGKEMKVRMKEEIRPSQRTHRSPSPRSPTPRSPSPRSPTPSRSPTPLRSRIPPPKPTKVRKLSPPKSRGEKPLAMVVRTVSHPWTDSEENIDNSPIIPGTAVTNLPSSNGVDPFVFRTVRERNFLQAMMQQLNSVHRVLQCQERKLEMTDRRTEELVTTLKRIEGKVDQLLALCDDRQPALE